MKKSVVRAGYGIFYNHSNRQGREGLLGFNFPFIIQGDTNISGSNNLKAANAFMRLQTGIPAGFVDATKVSVPSLARKAQDPFQRTTYVQQWNLGIQQEIATDVILDVAYVGNRGLKLAAFRNLNQRAVAFAANGTASAGALPLAPLNIMGDVQYLENTAGSNYHSFQARIEKRFARGLSASASYTWGKALTNAVDHLSTSGVGNGVDVGASRTPQDGNNRRLEYGPAEFDTAHRFVASAVWQLPIKKSSGAAKLLLADWEFSPIITAQTGLALTIGQSQLLNLGGERVSRPNRVGKGSLASDRRTADNYLDTTAFVALNPTAGMAGFVANQAYGNSGIGVVRGPGMVNFDFNLAKTIPITERQSMQFRAEFFNAFNRANFSVPGVTLGAGFGQIVYTSTESRIIQFALKYRF